MVGGPAAQVVRLLWLRMTEVGRQVTLCRVSFLQQKFLAPETSSHTGLMARLPLGKSVHPHVHMATLSTGLVLRGWPTDRMDTKYGLPGLAH